MRVRELDGLRAIAALSVIATHYFGWIKYTGAAYGWLGVDLFFVISGFLITSILLELRSKPRYFTTFYARRAFRIFPPYFFVLAIYLAVSLIAHRAGSWELWAKYALYYASLQFSDNLHYGLMLPVLLGLNVLWSLSVEELFYLLWAPVVRFLDRRYFGILIAVLITVAPLCRWALHSVSPNEMFTLYSRMDGLALGSLVAILASAWRQAEGTRFAMTGRIWDRACVVSGLLAVGYLAVAGANCLTLRVGVLGITLADLFFASLVFYIIRNAGGESLVLRILRLRPLRKIGMVSYSLYLVHSPILVVVQEIGSHFGLRGKPGLLAMNGLALIISLATSFAMWYGFESYSLKLKDRLFPSAASAMPPEKRQPCQPGILPEAADMEVAG